MPAPYDYTIEVIEWPMKGGKNWVVSKIEGRGYTPLREFPAGFVGMRDAQKWAGEYETQLREAESKSQ